MAHCIKPLFIFSLPRSGSTLLQRILATHPDIATAAEPWLLLSYLYSLKERGVCAEYSHPLAVAALADFLKELPRGKDDYFSELHDFVMRLYSKAAKRDARFFLDKTPRYHLVVDDVIRLFPEGNFIFLWRNPLAIIASIIETWGNGKWNVFRFDVDVFQGLNNLATAYEKHENRVYAMRYEDLLLHPEKECEKMFRALGLSYDEKVLSAFDEIKFKGCMGDPTGREQYSSLSKEPLRKWKAVLANPARKIWCRRYLRKMGAERLSIMGYELKTLLHELDAIPMSSGHIGSDLVRMSYGFVRPFLGKE